jgi:hypothetical protein
LLIKRSTAKKKGHGGGGGGETKKPGGETEKKPGENWEKRAEPRGLKGGEPEEKLVKNQGRIRKRKKAKTGQRDCWPSFRTPA